MTVLQRQAPAAGDHPLPQGERMRCAGWMKERRENFSSDALHRSVGHARGRVTGLADAPILILAAEHATACAIAVLVGAAAAQSQGGR